jgi:hypothetical protein
MSRPPIIRPATLREVSDESRSYEEFGQNLKDFLHEFAAARRRGLPLEPMLAAEPPLLAAGFSEGSICDAFLAATADHLARTSGFRTPEWALKPGRVLENPWFSDPLPALRGILLRDTPSAFKDKNLFVLESALAVA